MALHLNSVTVDALDPAAQARFWAEALGWHVLQESDDNQQALIAPGRNRAEGGSACPVMFFKVGAPKETTNRWHFDLASDEQEVELGRLERLGATRVDVGEGGTAWTVMADPEGNEFCILPSLAR